MINEYIQGEYYVEWREVGQCSAEKRGTNEISTNVRITKKNRKPEMVGNCTFLIDFDESISVSIWILFLFFFKSKHRHNNNEEIIYQSSTGEAKLLYTWFQFSLATECVQYDFSGRMFRFIKYTRTRLG